VISTVPAIARMAYAVARVAAVPGKSAAMSRAMEPTSANSGVWVSPATAKPSTAAIGMKTAARRARRAASPSGSRRCIRVVTRRINSAGVVMAGS